MTEDTSAQFAHALSGAFQLEVRKWQYPHLPKGVLEFQLRRVIPWQECGHILRALALGNMRGKMERRYTQRPEALSEQATKLDICKKTML
ncbi:MAG: hypothetical protein WCS16_06070 [Desulfuromonas sp.]